MKTVIIAIILLILLVVSASYKLLTECNNISKGSVFFLIYAVVGLSCLLYFAIKTLIEVKK